MTHQPLYIKLGFKHFLSSLRELSDHTKMGVARLRGHLERYSISKTLGCDNLSCQDRRYTVVIDGPSLAYHISSKLAAARQQNAQPSYAELEEAIVDYLERLEVANIAV